MKFRKFNTAFMVIIVTTLLITTNLVSATSGSLSQSNISNSGNYVQIEDGSYSYEYCSDTGAHWVDIEIDVDFKVKDGYKANIIIDNEDNQVYRWDKTNQYSIHSYGFDHKDYSTAGIKTQFSAKNSYDYVEERGTFYYRHKLYSTVSTDHFKIYLQILTEGGTTLESIVSHDVLNTGISYWDTCGGIII